MTLATPLPSPGLGFPEEVGQANHKLECFNTGAEGPGQARGLGVDTSQALKWEAWLPAIVLQASPALGRVLVVRTGKLCTFKDRVSFVAAHGGCGSGQFEIS